MTEHSNLGYTTPFFVLAFDHRSSFLKKMFGAQGDPPPEVTAELQEFKKVIYEGFEQAVAQGLPKAFAAILVDEQYGAAVLNDAAAQGYTICLTTEKSGQDEFDFDYGPDFAAHIEKYHPAFVKVLIRYNPEADQEMNARQRQRLKVLSDYCHQHGYKFLIEPLIPATKQQLANVGHDQHRYDTTIRPELMVGMIRELQNDGIEPDVWKIEGLEDAGHYEEVIKQARSGGRDSVSAVVLGRGADAAQVDRWLQAGGKVKGVIGFAIGRTIFWDALKSWKEKKMTRKEAAAAIAKNYLHFYEVFNGGK